MRTRHAHPCERTPHKCTYTPKDKQKGWQALTLRRQRALVIRLTNSNNFFLKSNSAIAFQRNPSPIMLSDMPKVDTKGVSCSSHVRPEGLSLIVSLSLPQAVHQASVQTLSLTEPSARLLDSALAKKSLCSPKLTHLMLTFLNLRAISSCSSQNLYRHPQLCSFRSIGKSHRKLPVYSTLLKNT